MKKILVALDGSEHAARALDEALALFVGGDMHLHLLTVCEPVHLNEVVFKDTLSDMRQLETEHKAAGQKIVDAAAGKAKQAGVSCDTHVEIGQAAQTIVEFAQKYHCDMIVMGSRGLGTIRSIALGSVAHKVVHLASVPVLLAK